MSGGRVDAVKASSLLDNVALATKQMDELDEEQRLQMQATGGFSTHNADQRWRVELAIAHALTAIALEMTQAELGP